MGFTKKQFVRAALEEIGIADYVFDLQPEQMESALTRLDAMIAQWNSRGIRIGYPLPGSPEFSDLDYESNVPDAANEAIITNLAIRIAPSYGKVVSRETKMIANKSYKSLLSITSVIQERQFPDTLPAGQGNKTWRYYDPFIRNYRYLASGPDRVFNFN